MTIDLGTMLGFDSQISSSSYTLTQANHFKAVCLVVCHAQCKPDASIALNQLALKNEFRQIKARCVIYFITLIAKRMSTQNLQPNMEVTCGRDFVTSI